MKKYEWKPLLLVMPFFILIAIFAVFDYPIEETETANDSITMNEGTTEEKATTNVNLDAGEKTTAATENTILTTAADVPINPIKNAPKREIPADAKRIKIAIGLVGSMELGGGDFIYEEPDDSSTQIAQLEFHCAVECAESQYDDEWVHVKLKGNDEDGYIKAESVHVMELAIGDEDPVRDAIVKNAFSYLGLAFKKGGSSLSQGIDCSNFVSKIYGLSGIELPTRPKQQLKVGTIIHDADALPGDLVYYDRANNGSGHVGIYLGDGIIIHSSGHSGSTYPDGGVRLSCLYYPDRDHFYMLNMMDTESEVDEDE